MLCTISLLLLLIVVLTVLFISFLRILVARISGCSLILLPFWPSQE